MLFDGFRGTVRYTAEYQMKGLLTISSNKLSSSIFTHDTKQHSVHACPHAPRRTRGYSASLLSCEAQGSLDGTSGRQSIDHDMASPRIRYSHHAHGVFSYLRSNPT